MYLQMVDENRPIAFMPWHQEGTPFVTFDGILPKIFAYNNLFIDQMIWFVSEGLENAVVKGENAGNHWCYVNSLPIYKIFYFSQFKTFADNKMILTQKVDLCLEA